MAITYITTANTFQQWVVATQDLITVANNLTDGGYSQTFYANTNLSIGGDLTVTGNLTLDSVGYDDLSVAGNATITLDTTIGGTLDVTGDATLQNVTVNSAATLNVTHGGFIGTANTNIYSEMERIENQSLAYAIALG